ncbi:MAG: hypothetical protein IKR17_03060 [Bacteroidales bacterium]|nr:hypothetical protein [Bacteroidales bacterium]
MNICISIWDTIGSWGTTIGSLGTAIAAWCGYKQWDRVNKHDNSARIVLVECKSTQKDVKIVTIQNIGNAIATELKFIIDIDDVGFQQTINDLDYKNYDFTDVDKSSVSTNAPQKEWYIGTLYPQNKSEFLLHASSVITKINLKMKWNDDYKKGRKSDFPITLQ